MDKDTARTVCELVAGVLHADGEVHPAEGKLLGRIVKACGDPFEFGQELQPKVRGADAARALSELPTDVRDKAFELLIEAAVVDGKVDPAEQRFLEPLAKAMGWTADQLEERITDRLMDG